MFFKYALFTAALKICRLHNPEAGISLLALVNVSFTTLAWCTLFHTYISICYTFWTAKTIWMNVKLNYTIYPGDQIIGCLLCTMLIGQSGSI